MLCHCPRRKDARVDRACHACNSMQVLESSSVSAPWRGELSMRPWACALGDVTPRLLVQRIDAITDPSRLLMRTCICFLGMFVMARQCFAPPADRAPWCAPIAHVVLMRGVRAPIAHTRGGGACGTRVHATSDVRSDRSFWIRRQRGCVALCMRGSLRARDCTHARRLAQLDAQPSVPSRGEMCAGMI